MEVHHHAHPSTGSGHRKKWTHYFWEFLMLFLAVFCGFLAEYQLEHKIERDRERQFIVSLSADLKNDIIKIDEHIERENIAIALLDTLCRFLDTPAIARQSGDIIYYAARVGPRSAPFVNNSRTYDQLMNSGGFRLINKSATSNRIMDYYSQFPWLRLLEGIYNREFDAYKEVAAKIIDPGIYRRQENPDGTINRSTDNPPLLSYDASRLKEMEFFAVQMNGSRRSLIPLIKELRKSALGLLKYLQENYHLE